MKRSLIEPSAMMRIRLYYRSPWIDGHSQPQPMASPVLAISRCVIHSPIPSCLSVPGGAALPVELMSITPLASPLLHRVLRAWCLIWMVFFPNTAAVWTHRPSLPCCLTVAPILTIATLAAKRRDRHYAHSEEFPCSCTAEIGVVLGRRGYTSSPESNKPVTRQEERVEGAHWFRCRRLRSYSSSPGCCGSKQRHRRKSTSGERSPYPS